MTKSKFIKLSGWALVVGSFAFITMLGGSIAGAVTSSILLAIGMLGLRARYGESVGSLGRNILLIGVVGMALVYASVPIFREVGVFYVQPPGDTPGYILPFAGPAVLLTGLAIFGLVALNRKPLPHVNWLPFFAGIGFPVFYFSTFFSAVMNNGASPAWIDNHWTIISIIASLQFLALCILGLVLQDGVPEETAVPA